MDPWSTCQQGDVTKFESLSYKFEDNFSLPVSQSLPDSEQYLATLGEYELIVYAVLLLTLVSLKNSRM